eukprot:TRINITY_DN2496_c0_g1_i1.p1 TRINITY_DN2496_c0_g1~~TRINITY_DN2496_c0_g1_i1.p1  ORF type:complete len:985 (+),score=217.73 TRINITY_DN2496_c0_g1_i1:387-2957(+)
MSESELPTEATVTDAFANIKADILIIGHESFELPLPSMGSMSSTNNESKESINDDDESKTNHNDDSKESHQQRITANNNSISTTNSNNSDKAVTPNGNGNGNGFLPPIHKKWTSVKSAARPPSQRSMGFMSRPSPLAKHKHSNQQRASSIVEMSSASPIQVTSRSRARNRLSLQIRAAKNTDVTALDIIPSGLSSRSNVPPLPLTAGGSKRTRKSSSSTTTSIESQSHSRRISKLGIKETRIRSLRNKRPQTAGNVLPPLNSQTNNSTLVENSTITESTTPKSSLPSTTTMTLTPKINSAALVTRPSTADPKLITQRKMSESPLTSSRNSKGSTSTLPTIPISSLESENIDTPSTSSTSQNNKQENFSENKIGKESKEQTVTFKSIPEMVRERKEKSKRLFSLEWNSGSISGIQRKSWLAKTVESNGDFGTFEINIRACDVIRSMVKSDSTDSIPLEQKGLLHILVWLLHRTSSLRARINIIKTLVHCCNDHLSLKHKARELGALEPLVIMVLDTNSSSITTLGFEDSCRFDKTCGLLGQRTLKEYHSLAACKLIGSLSQNCLENQNLISILGGVPVLSRLVSMGNYVLKEISLIFLVHWLQKSYANQEFIIKHCSGCINTLISMLDERDGDWNHRKGAEYASKTLNLLTRHCDGDIDYGVMVADFFHDNHTEIFDRIFGILNRSIPPFAALTENNKSLWETGVSATFQPLIMTHTLKANSYECEGKVEETGDINRNYNYNNTTTNNNNNDNGWVKINHQTIFNTLCLLSQLCFNHSPNKEIVKSFDCKRVLLKILQNPSLPSFVTTQVNLTLASLVDFSDLIPRTFVEQGIFKAVKKKEFGKTEGPITHDVNFMM